MDRPHSYVLNRLGKQWNETDRQQRATKQGESGKGGFLGSFPWVEWMEVANTPFPLRVAGAERTLTDLLELTYFLCDDVTVGVRDTSRVAQL